MRILQILPSLVNGGVESETVDTVKAITDAGGKAYVASAGGLLVEKIIANGGVHIELPLKTKSPLSVYCNISKLQKIIRDHQIQLVHARSRAPAWSAYYASKRENVPFVTTYHGAYGMKGWGKKKYNQVMLKGDRIMVPSQFITHHLKKNYFFDQRKLRTVPSGIDTTYFDPITISAKQAAIQKKDWGAPAGNTILLMPGRLSRIKGCDVAIEALAALKKRNVSLVFVGAVGNTYEQELATRAKELNLQDHVFFCPPSQNMPLTYAAADIIISASRKPESFGRTIVEAQAMGKPIIATKHGGAVELISHERTGWLIQPEEPQKLARTLKKMMELSPKALEDITTHARDVVTHTYTANIMGQKTIAVYRELL